MRRRVASDIALADVQLMLAKRSTSVPRIGRWHYEIKFDGYRMLAGTMPFKLRTRGGLDATAWFPELSASIGNLPAGAHILDCEVCVLDDLGRSDFNRLHERALRRRWYPGATPVVLCAFDLLVHHGKDIRGLPIETRKAKLRSLVAGVPSVLFVDSDDDGEWLYSAVLSLGLEGVVAKRVGSLYVAGASSDWLKIKRPGAVTAGSFHRAI